MDDELVATVVEQVQGMSAEEIQAQIEASSNAGAFGDPALVAGFLAAKTTQE